MLFSLSHKKIDLMLFVAIVACLLIMGLIFVYSASSVYALERFGAAHYYAKRQLFGIFLGFFALLLGRYLPKTLIEHWCPLFFLVGLSLTLMTLIPFLGVSVHGSHRWLHLCGITFQPSELLKIGFILFMAQFLAKKEHRVNSLIYSYIPFLCILGVTSIALLLQPDFGLTVTLTTTGFIMAYIACFPLKRMVCTLFATVPIIIGLVWVKPYRFKRVLTFLNPWADPKGAGFQIIQSLIAIGSGSYWGTGISHSRQKFFYLPMQHTDFIFSIIAEETGFIGVLFLITLYMMLLYFGLRCATSIKSSFARYSIIGFVSLITLQTIINIAVTTGMVPTKGIGLPLISYGNTSLVCTLFMIGIVINFAQDQ